MKVNLLLNSPSDVRQGYVNVDPLAPHDNTDGRIGAPLHKLDGLVEANEATELVALDVLDCYPRDQAPDVLDHWVSRLAHGGRITVSVVDLREVARALLANSLSLAETNDLLHGEPGGLRTRQCVLTMQHLCEVLENKGLKLLQRRVVNKRAVVSFERP